MSARPWRIEYRHRHGGGCRPWIRLMGYTYAREASAMKTATRCATYTPWGARADFRVTSVADTDTTSAEREASDG
jgi:hypothetical protein